MLIQQPAYLYFLGSLERIMARASNRLYNACFIRSQTEEIYLPSIRYTIPRICRLFAALYQTKTINIFVAEGITLLFTIGAVVLIRKMKAKLMSVPGKK